MFAKSLILVVLFLSPLVQSFFGRDQSVKVVGRLTCETKAAGNVRVKLYDEDRTDFDDLMAEGYTDADGNFTLSGYTDEFSVIESKFNVYHFCNSNKETNCPMKFTIRIPEEFITYGQKPEKTFNVGELKLEGEHPGQARDCFH